MSEKSQKAAVVVQDDRTGMDDATLVRAVIDHLRYSFAKNSHTASADDVYLATSLAIRDRLIHRWMKTMKRYYVTGAKRVYYLSAEYLLGRSMGNNLLNMGMYTTAQKLLAEHGIVLDEIEAEEPDPGLGNGGLGRLAACFLDSLATLGYPAMGYGIRYEFGIFKQSFKDGWQVESRDPWLERMNPWEMARPDLAATVNFGGTVEHRTDEDGNLRCDWVNTKKVRGIPYDMPIAGYDTETVNSLRLWAAHATDDFNLGIFNAGDFRKAVEDKVISETISKVLYPADNNPEGRELRLKQQYFFVCCSIHDIVRRYKKTHKDFGQFADKVAIQLNDTHPAIAVAELMRVLVDLEHVKWEDAWSITEKVFGYTNHTLLPEALERWPLPMFEKLLPRHLEIIYEINRRFLLRVHIAYPGDYAMQRRVSIIDETGEKFVRMANLAVIGSHSVNGVAALHSELVKTDLFADFVKLMPERFNNKTNGVTLRRWMLSSNPELSALISEKIGTAWVKDASQLKKLDAYADDKAFLDKILAIKAHNKTRFMHQYLPFEVSTDMLFDVQVKRIHEYKRQLLNVLHVIHLYRLHKKAPNVHRVPRLVLFGGKAAPGYVAAKLHIKLINDVARIINDDPTIKDKLRVYMCPNYCVSMAEVIIPAADLSEQISTAGKEASGTGNMKFALNGALTIGTLDGANIEIREQVGEENFFLFGLTETEVKTLQAEGYDPSAHIEECEDLKAVLDMLESGFFSPEDRTRYRDTVQWLRTQDPYMLCADFNSYITCQKAVEDAFRDKYGWAKMCVHNIARMGFFSSDRTIHQYAQEIWKLSPVQVQDGD
ncbi:MAG: glycogen/starch/alpha-glucan phosphorylase [Proteobacteria bacterium]|nr:glycogen/starch/alpha-glucan phosphorylase [Pseudomonadota bacterium]